MHVDLPSYWANRPQHLIKFIIKVITDIILSADGRKHTYMISGISTYKGKWGLGTDLTDFQEFVFQTL